MMDYKDDAVIAEAVLPSLVNMLYNSEEHQSRNIK